MPPAFRLSDLLGSTPAPVQLDLIRSTEFEIGMITGFAAGKTRGICAKAIKHCIDYPKAKVLLGRRTYLETINTVKQPFFLMADLLHRAGWIIKPLRWDYREGTNNLRFTNGSQIFFSNLDDPIKFRNEEYSLVCVDQAEELQEDLWETLTGRIRWDQVPPEAWQAIAAANDNGHNWVWRRFVDFPTHHAVSPTRCTRDELCVFDDSHPDEDGTPQDIPCSTRRFFHGTTLDNKHNLSARYLASLLSHPAVWQRHFIYATMEGGGGRLLPDPRVVPHFDPPPHWPRYRAIDHALNAPCCCLWLTANTDPVEVKGVPSGSVYVYREYWKGESSVDQHAERILALSKNETVLNTVIDRSTLHKTQSREGGVRLSILDLYAEAGLFCTPSVGDPFARVERIVTAHRQGMIVSVHCSHLIKQMPEYYAVQSKLSGEYKIVNKSDFHSVDALGYGLMVIPVDPVHDGRFPGDERPDYLRRPIEDALTRRHHEGEWKRMKKIEDEAKYADMAPVFGTVNAREFWGGDDLLDEDLVEIAGGFDPWGRG